MATPFTAVDPATPSAASPPLSSSVAPTASPAILLAGEELAGIVEAVLAEATPGRAAAAFCSRLAVSLGARRVCLGVLVAGRGRSPASTMQPGGRGAMAPRRCRVVAESFRPRPDLPPEQLQALVAVMFEACDQQVIVDSTNLAVDGPIAQCARALAAHNLGRVLAVPLGESGEVYGALVIEGQPVAPRAAAAPGGDAQSALPEMRTTDWPADEAVHGFLIRLAPLAARLLSLIEVQGRRVDWWLRVAGGPAEQPGLPPMAGAGQAFLARLSGRVGGRAPAHQGDPRLGLRRRLIGAGVVVLLAVLIWPWPHSISAPARLEGEVQRVVAAPADGYLKEVLVRPGDRVRAGQLLGALGERELELERARLGSDLAQRGGEKSVALAKGDRAAMMIAQARMDEAQAQLDLIEQQSQRYLLTAPIDGVVIEGDWVRSVGAPLERGKALFTVAPVDRYRVIVDLDERDLALVRAGQSGRLALSALPSEEIRLKVVRMAAAAAVVDGRNAFEVEAEPIDPPAAGLRPGLRGVARLSDEPRSLLAVWGRRLSHALRGLWWRWWP